MFKKLFGRAAAAPRQFHAPDGEIAYAIGDIHGCFEEMQDLLSKVAADAARHPELKVTLVFLGDLIDRGTDSSKVVEFLRSYQPEFVDNLVFLMGNHEEVLLDVTEGSVDRLKSWFQFGGKSCVRSYGVDNLGEILINPDSLLIRVQRAIPASHIQFIRQFKDCHNFGDYLFVHAGVNPKTALDKQTSQDMRWIRDRFLKHQGNFSKKIVHGHSVVEIPEDLSNRIAVDTGAYAGNPLTAVCIHGDRVRFLQSESRDAEQTM